MKAFLPDTYHLEAVFPFTSGSLLTSFAIMMKNNRVSQKSDSQNAAEAQKSKPKLSVAGTNVSMDMTWESLGPALS